MWQVGVRYDHVDLNDGRLLTPTSIDGVLGGKEDNLTIGVNWYLRSNFKLAANYVKVNSTKYNPSALVHDYVDDDPSIIEFRAQFYW
jgi:phosphate-selective porin OprO/OprP